MQNKPAIIIFAYNRPYHLKKLLKSLEKNILEYNQKIFLFCDGPKYKNDIDKIDLIKIAVKSSKLNFHFVKYRKKNIGLSKNIIKGVTSALKKINSCIVLEDDLILNKKTIDYMNKMLKYFQNDLKIGSISAYSYLQNYKKFKKYKFYSTKRHCSWCWGTWSRVWKKIKWNKINYASHFKSQKKINKFSEAGNDLNLLLWGHYKNLINSWAIRFNYFCSKENLLSIQTRYTMVINDGRDESGTHERFNLKKKYNFNFYPKYLSKKKIFNCLISSENIDNFIKNSHRKSIKLSVKYFLANGKRL